MAKGKDIARVGLSGLGSFSAIIGDAVQRSQKLELVTCFDALPERRAAAAEKYGCTQEKSFADMVNRDDLDGILLVTPNAFHCEQTEMAAKYGKHVYLVPGDPIQEEIDEFADCILTGKKPETDGLAGLRALALIRASIESARTGKPVHLEV